MTLLAAALLMQAAAGATVAPPPSFDLAALFDAATDPTVEEALALTVGAGEERCSSPADDPFQPDVIVVCAQGPRVEYRVTTVSAPVQAPPAAAERLTNRTGCGVSQNPNGCFAGVAVLRVGSSGAARVLPDRADEERTTSGR